MPRAKKTAAADKATKKTVKQQEQATAATAKAQEPEEKLEQEPVQELKQEPAQEPVQEAQAEPQATAEPEATAEPQEEAQAQDATAQQSEPAEPQAEATTASSTQLQVSQAEINASLAVKLRMQADSIVSKYSVWGAGAGLVPMPAWDLLAIGTVQVMMLKELYALYGVSFNEKKARTTVHLLLAGLSPRLLAGASVSSLLKAIPVVGTALASVTMPILSSAATYATGKLMVAHLAAGGCLENFNIEANKAKFAEEVENAVEKGKNAAANVKQTAKEQAEMV